VPEPHTFLARSRYYLAGEYPAKIRLAVQGLPHELIWRRTNEESNSIGNLLLHLSGNISQWIVAGVGGRSVDRNRPAEFQARDGPGAAELLSRLESTVREADAVLAQLDEGDLSQRLVIQGRQTTALAAIYHVVEHFSMHTGQILMLAKALAPGTVKFYDDADGIAVPLWGGQEGMPGLR
jgi:uncharacterized damage-inducible protein DinB